jgi:hypothetical protein
MSATDTYIVGPRGIGKSQFFNQVAHHGLDSFGAGELVPDGLDSYATEPTTLVSFNPEDLRTEEVGDETFHPRMQGTTQVNSITVTPRRNAASRQPPTPFLFTDVPGGAAHQPGTYEKDLAAFRASARTVLLFVPYWSVVPGTRRQSSSPDFLKELRAWVKEIRDAPYETLYIVLNQFGRNYRSDFVSVPDDTLLAQLSRLDGDVELLHRLRVGAGGTLQAARRFLALTDELDQDARQLIHPEREAGNLILPLLRPRAGRNVRVIVQNTVANEVFSMDELRALLEDQGRAEFDKRWAAVLNDRVRRESTQFFPVHDRLTWLPFFLASLRQNVRDARW